MALDTTVGGASADSYGSLAEADAYFSARVTGNWDGADSHKEMALRRATTYLDNIGRGRWKGLRNTSAQALAWPRAGAYDEDGYPIATDTIPTALKRAQFEAAYLIANGTNLEATIDRAVKSEQVGPLAVTYMDGAADQARYQTIFNYLSGLMNVAGGPGASFGQIPMVRA